MSEELVINKTSHETCVALMEDGVVQELHIERAAAESVVGNIYLGTVARVLPGMQSAFIDIGLGRSAFLHVADLLEARDTTASPHTFRPIAQVLCEGQRLLVQVVKAPVGTKGARLSTRTSVVGRLLVYLPQQEFHIGVSQRITAEDERTRLKDLVQSLLSSEEQTGGYIVRTSADGIESPTFYEDMCYLHRRWQQILETSNSATPPALLYQELNLSQRALRDVANTNSTNVIWVDSPSVLADLTAFARTYIPFLADRLRLNERELPLFERYQLGVEMDRALNRRVDLRSGGYLIFDQTEAMTTIDVNTGGCVGEQSFDETVFRTNLEAAQAITRQLRLRSIGGIIVVDFIDMTQEEHREAVLQTLREGLAKDRIKAFVNGFTSLGLVEITRKRMRESLSSVLCETCAVCQGRALVKTPRTVAYEILHEVIRCARVFRSSRMQIRAPQPVLDVFLEGEGESLADIERAANCSVFLQAENSYAPEQYDVIPG